MNVTLDMKKLHKFLVIITVSLLAVHGNSWSQENVKIKSNSFKTAVENGYKEAWRSVKEGDRYYKDGLGTYALARDHYLFAHQYNPEHAGLNYKLGVCYLFTDSKFEAIDYLLRAYELDPQVSSDIHLVLGMAYQGAVEGTTGNLTTLVQLLPPDTIFNCCAVGATQLPMTTLAVLLGGNARVGMEDNNYYSKGELAKSNAQLVARTIRIVREIGFEIASPDEARQMLGLPPRK